MSVVGLTLPLPLTLGRTLRPLPGETDTLVTQLLFQLRELEFPLTIDVGLAEMLTDGQTMMFPALGSR